MRVLIVGTGTIARELGRLIHETHPGWLVEFFSSRTSRDSFSIAVELVDIFFVAISTKDNGLAAAQYIQEALQSGKLVVTCEKGALSEYFHVMRPYLNRLGYSTTAGGASFMIDLLNQPRGKIVRMTAIVNGSCNNISWLVEHDADQDVQAAIRQTQKDGYTDPHEQSLGAIINGELTDACRKGVILHNFAYPDQSIKHSETSRTIFSEDGMYHLFAKRKEQEYAKRLIVDIGIYDARSIHQYHADNPCFWARTATHYITGAFRDPAWWFPMIPYGVENCLRVQYEDGTADFKYGIGAGITATARAMIVDAERLLASS